MAKLRVVGCEIRSGTYEGHDYNNLLLHCMGEPKDNFEGHPVEIVKVSMVRAGALLEKAQGVLGNLIGLNIDPVYDRNSKVDRIFILED